MVKSATVVNFTSSLRSRLKKNSLQSPVCIKTLTILDSTHQLTSAPFPFLQLPPELRNQIYGLVLQNDSPVSLLPPSKHVASARWMPEPQPVAGVLPALFSVSRAVRAEATHHYYTSNTFFLSPSSISSSIESLFGTGRLYDNLRQIRWWHVDVDLTKYTYRENLHGSLSLRSFWKKHSESDVTVEVHLRLSKETRFLMTLWQVEAAIETGVSWWLGVIGSDKGDFGLRVFLHANTGPDQGILDAARCTGFRLLPERRNGEVLEDESTWREVFEWVLEDSGKLIGERQERRRAR